MSGNHEHGHTHEHGHARQSPEETAALLTYMTDHNRHHGEDLHEIYHALEAAGKTEAAGKLHRAMRLYEDGNKLLAEALELIK